MHKQLEDFLNKCIEMWWLHKIFDKWCYVLEDWVYADHWSVPIFSFHDLFSKGSGLMEFVWWKYSGTFLLEEERYDYMREKLHHAVYANWKLYHYMVMSDMTAQEKIKYFLENAYIKE